MVNEIEKLREANREQLAEICRLRLQRYNLAQSKIKLLKEKTELQDRVTRQMVRQKSNDQQLKELRAQQEQIKDDWLKLQEKMAILANEVNQLADENEKLRKRNESRDQ